MSKSIICFPSDPVNTRKVDEAYESDAKAFARLGCAIAVWNMDEPDSNIKVIQGAPQENIPIIWRGWMLDSNKYHQWSDKAHHQNYVVAVSMDQYHEHHRVDKWSKKLQRFTTQTWLLPAVNWEGLIDDLNVFPCHVKDFVKSANAHDLPRPCHSGYDILEHVEAIKKQRGALEGGLALRQHIFVDDSFPETRTWVINNAVYIPPAVDTPELRAWCETLLATQEPSVPFTMDIVKNTAGQYLVMDCGDAGVSDWKEWEATPSHIDTIRVQWNHWLDNIHTNPNLDVRP